MKCEHCGKNEVTFVYRSNINGHVEEKHLCGDCAQQLGYAFAAQSRQMMQDVFGDSFFGGLLTPMPNLLGRRGWLLEDPFDDFFADMPALRAAPAQKTQETEAPKEQPELVEPAEQSRFSRLRQHNALKLELRKAIRQEEYERAAELRDQIRALESKSEQ